MACHFSPLPNRAALDARLTRTDIRVLWVIAMHDRFGRNGLGCTIGTQAIADKLGAERATVARSILRLVKFGYLTRSRHPRHKQMFMLSAVYDEVADKAALTTKTDIPQDTGLPEEPVFPRTQAESETCVPQNTHKRRPLKGREDIPLKAASACANASKQSEIGAHLSKLERALKGGAQLQNAREIREWLEEVHMSEEHGGPNAGRAYRLLEEWEWPDDDVAVNQ